MHRAGFLGILAGKSPLSVCAAAIYFTCWLLAGNTGEGTSGTTTGTPGTTGKPTTTLTDGSMDPKKLRKTLRDISPVAGVNESTIKNAYKDLWASRREVTEGLSVPGFPYFGTPAPPKPPPSNPKTSDPLGIWTCCWSLGVMIFVEFMPFSVYIYIILEKIKVTFSVVRTVHCPPRKMSSSSVPNSLYPKNFNFLRLTPSTIADHRSRHRRQIHKNHENGHFPR